MSGHSKWSTIKRQKGAADIKRGLTFTKLANAITITVKLSGSGDPDSNPRLRVVMEEARSVNMPKENMQRAIDRGLGKLPGQTLEEVTYEGFGPGKVAFYLEAVTDNKLRTLQEIKNLFERSGGNLGGLGSSAYLFSPKGEIKVRSKEGSSEDEQLELIDCGAEDVEAFQEENMQTYLVYTEGVKLNEVSNKITQAGFKILTQNLIMKPISLQQIDDIEMAKKVIEFVDKLEEYDDIQKVYNNMDINEDILTDVLK